MRIAISIMFFLLYTYSSSFAQEVVDSTISRLIGYVKAVNNFSFYIPQEKVYLHFDNTSYYKGDNIWFKCYVITSELHKATNLSKTLYVDLLNPGGEIIDKKILKIEDGQCSGEFVLNYSLFYSGFYEVRAYTKYMLNWDEDIIFSRIFPVFDKPEKEGDFTQKGMKRTSKRYPMKREKLKKAETVNLVFFPEGGSFVSGVQSEVAFKATDEFGNPISADGAVVNKQKEEISRFSVSHEGLGVFTYTPVGDEDKVIVRYNGKEYQFELPQPLSEGFVMNVDNLSFQDSIRISLKKNENTQPDTLGIATFCRGKIYDFSIVNIPDNNEISFGISKNKLPSGISQIILFNRSGQNLSNRMIFINKNNYLTIKGKLNKDIYKPYELADVEFMVTDKQDNPVQTTFSLSVRDGDNEVEYNNNVMTNLLLSSEINGYISNPAYYFEANDTQHQRNLDLLLMVQGWRRYVWNQMFGIKPFDIKFEPEQGIEIQGQVKSYARGEFKPFVDVSYFLTERKRAESGEIEEGKGTIMGSVQADSLGRFRLMFEKNGKWDIALSTSEKGKNKTYNVVLDRLFRPAPRSYNFQELQVNISDIKVGSNRSGNIIANYEDSLAFLSVSEDSLRMDINEKIHHLDEITVTAKRSILQEEI